MYFELQFENAVADITADEFKTIDDLGEQGIR
jgi:hypothetical protein